MKWKPWLYESILTRPLTENGAIGMKMRWKPIYGQMSACVTAYLLVPAISVQRLLHLCEAIHLRDIQPKLPYLALYGEYVMYIPYNINMRIIHGNGIAWFISNLTERYMYTYGLSATSVNKNLFTLILSFWQKFKSYCFPWELRFFIPTFYATTNIHWNIDCGL